jgi:hypothetical protein
VDYVVPELFKSKKYHKIFQHVNQKFWKNGFVLCGLYNDVSMESYIHSLERQGV